MTKSLVEINLILDWYKIIWHLFPVQGVQAENIFITSGLTYKV